MAREFSHVHFIGIDIGDIASLHTVLTLLTLILVPIATQHPPPRVLFEVHDVNNTYRWKDGTFDLVHARFVSMAVSNSFLNILPILSSRFFYRFVTTQAFFKRSLVFFVQVASLCPVNWAAM